MEQPETKINIIKNDTNIESQITNYSRVKGSRGCKRPQLRRSNFLITISSNIVITSLNESDRTKVVVKFENAIDEFCNDILPNKMLNLTSGKIGEDCDQSFVNIPLDKRIENKNIEYGVEIGNNKGILHCHILFATSHRGLGVKLNLESMREHFRKIFGYDLYINYKIFHDSMASIGDYVSKASIQQF